jgi:predicted hotdog family 3-hydroxylacyl-ACP dehydratase
MLLLDTVLEVDENHAITETLVKTSWPTAATAGVSSLLCVELVAQTIGVCNVWRLMRVDGENANKNGWLVAVKKAIFHAATLPIGARLTIRVENGFCFHPFCESTGLVHWQGKLVAEVVAQIYQDEA